MEIKANLQSHWSALLWLKCLTISSVLFVCSLIWLSVYLLARWLRTFALIVSAHPYCARKSTCHAMPRHASSARAKLKWTMIGQMANAIALIGFNDLGRSLTPTFLFRNWFHSQLSPHCPKMNKKSMWEVEKKFKILVYGTWNPTILRLQGEWNYGR